MNIGHICRIFVFTAVTVCFSVSCEKTPETEKTVTGTVIANEEGKILFAYSRTKGSLPESCTFTTDLQAPNDVFIIAVDPGNSTGKKEIYIDPEQVVAWTAVVEGKPMSHGSGYFVHIVND